MNDEIRGTSPDAQQGNTSAARVTQKEAVLGAGMEPSGGSGASPTAFRGCAFGIYKRDSGKAGPASPQEK